MIAYFVFLFVGPVVLETKVGEAGFRFPRLVLFPLAIAIYLLVSIMALNVARYVNKAGSKHAVPLVTVILTFLGFTSALYLQSKINALGQDSA